MIVILTYHRVVDTPPAGVDPEFYSITPAAFELQLQMLQSFGFQFITPEVVRNEPNLPAKPCLLTFDDGTQDHYDAVFPLLKKYNASATFFVCTSKFDQPGYLSRAQLQELTANGHIIGCHGHQNRRLDVLSNEQIHEHIRLSHELIREATGRAPQCFAPPGGYSDGRVRAAAFSMGMDLIRTMRWGYNDLVAPMALECIPLNRHISSTQFHDILHRRRALAMALTYRIKETTKLLLPTRLYEYVRQFISAILHIK